MRLKKDKQTYRHPFHIVSASPWPFFTSMNIFILIIGVVLYLHFFERGAFLAIWGFFGLIWSLYGWWSDIIFEATVQGAHTFQVQRGLRYGFLLFIASEIMFFFGFFFAFFYVSLSPSIQIGAIWPPLGIEVLDPWSIPFLNTLILVLSGACATIAHHIFRLMGLTETSPISVIVHSSQFSEKLNPFKKAYLKVFCMLSKAIGLGFTFTLFQLYEYVVAPFSMSDGIYGSIFFLATGFHGLHVLIGTIFLSVVLFRHCKNHFFGRHFFAVEASVWYRHFVDVVWLFLFVSIYWWGS